MGNVTYFGFAPPHDPTYGIDRSNIVEKLTRLNWRTKAVCRIREDRCLYILVEKGCVHSDGKSHDRYFVNVHLGAKDDRHFRRDFGLLKDAIAYANGRDGSDFALSTRPAKITEYPLGHGADTYITGFGGTGGQLHPSFTVKIPGA